MSKKRIVSIIDVDDPQGLMSDLNNTSDASALIEIKLATPGVKIDVVSYSSVDHLVGDLVGGNSVPVIQHNEDAYSFLYFAIRNGDVRAVKMFLEFGLDPNRENSGVTLLGAAAAQNRHPVIAAMLLERGALINQPNIYGSTPLHSAAIASGSAKMVEFLLANGADPTLRNKAGKLPVDIVYEEEVRALLERHPASFQLPQG